VAFDSRLNGGVFGHVTVLGGTCDVEDFVPKNKIEAASVIEKGAGFDRQFMLQVDGKLDASCLIHPFELERRTDPFFEVVGKIWIFLVSPEFCLGSAQVASRNGSIFSLSCRSMTNFAKLLPEAEFRRNSGMLWRRALATTSSEGGMPGRMVRSHEPK